MGFVLTTSVCSQLLWSLISLLPGENKVKNELKGVCSLSYVHNTIVKAAVLDEVELHRSRTSLF